MSGEGVDGRSVVNIDDLVESEPGSLGVYLSLLYLVGWKGYSTLYKNQAGALLEEPDAKKLFADFMGRDSPSDVLTAKQAAYKFLERILPSPVPPGSIKGTANDSQRAKLLNDLEVAHIRDFTKAYASHLKTDRIPETIRPTIARLLFDITALIPERTLVSRYTWVIYDSSLQNWCERQYGLDAAKTRELIRTALVHRLLVMVSYDQYLVPFASVRSLNPLESTAPSKPPVANLIPPPSESQLKDYVTRPPTYEILEGIVRDVLTVLGFRADANVRKETREGERAEVDVWASKQAGSVQFTVYTSCKNWDKAVDRPVVDQEVGRVSNLRELPHLKVLVAKELNDHARSSAKANGFMVVELGTKADDQNAAECFGLVHRAINELFVGIAPSWLADRAVKIEQMATELRGIADSMKSGTLGTRAS